MRRYWPSIETFGFIHPESQKVLDTLINQYATYNNSDVANARQILYSNISIALQIYNADTIIRRDPRYNGYDSGHVSE